ENASVKAELAGLEQEFKQYEGVPLFKEKSEEQIEKEIKQFEKMMADIGAVNMKALEIYERAEQEYEGLMKKKDKLGKEREDVLVMINEIDSKKKELFMRTYNVLNENFKKIFSSLTTKGEGSFELEDENDPFAAGMTIKVRLVGKKFLDIRSLSGGEKTLTALSFIFAVQEYAPASFYVLDEVDAALDKHNSEKFAKLIRSYCRNAQYIIISHNDSVISEADNLYGVSMDQDSISKVTSLKI
ncbi:MAG TPA: AAA family ATPase, partial [Candidatus Nanoarchaeia archaeon]|nr:AAA family ATPase [Candidatus Nanoarchaeia archaeon]